MFRFPRLTLKGLLALSAFASVLSLGYIELGPHGNTTRLVFAPAALCVALALTIRENLIAGEITGWGETGRYRFTSTHTPIAYGFTLTVKGLLCLILIGIALMLAGVFG